MVLYRITAKIGYNTAINKINTAQNTRVTQIYAEVNEKYC